MGAVRKVRVNYRGSQPQYAPVLLQGVPAHGVIDSSADITIVGGDLFRKVAWLKGSQLKRVDKVPHTYDRKTFSLDGRVDLDVTFNNITMNTPVYVKLDSPEPLLLAEGVCRQLKIISYHHDVAAGNSQRRADGKVWDNKQVAPATATSSAAAKVDSFCNANHSATHHSQSKEPQPTQLLPREPQLRDSQQLGDVGTSPTEKPDVQVPALAGGRGRETGATGYTILPRREEISRPDRDGAGGTVEPDGTGESVRKSIAKTHQDNWRFLIKQLQ